MQSKYLYISDKRKHNVFFLYLCRKDKQVRLDSAAESIIIMFKED